MRLLFIYLFYPLAIFIPQFMQKRPKKDLMNSPSSVNASDSTHIYHVLHFAACTFSVQDLSSRHVEINMTLLLLPSPFEPQSEKTHRRALI